MAEIAETIELEPKEGLSEKIGLVVVALMAISTVFVFSAGVEVSKGIDLQHFYQSANLRKVLFFPIAVALMFSVSRIDYRRRKDWPGKSDRQRYHKIPQRSVYAAFRQVSSKTYFEKGKNMNDQSDKKKIAKKK